MKKWLQYFVVGIGALFFLTGFTVPKHTNGVYDETNQLSQDVIQKIVRYNEQFANSDKKPQMALLVINSLDGDTIESVANATAREWQIGYSSSNAGALVVIAIKDRKMRIETSDEMATVVTDYDTQQILDLGKNDFRSGDYSAGIDKIISALAQKISDKWGISLSDDLISQSFTVKKDDVGSFIATGIILFASVAFIFSSLFKGVYDNTKYHQRVPRRRNHVTDMLLGIALSELMNDKSRRHHKMKKKSRRHHKMKKKSRRIWNDDDDFFGGFGSGSSSSSSSWSGDGFSGGGSSSGW